MFPFDYKAFYIVLSILGGGLLIEGYRYLKTTKKPLPVSPRTGGQSGILMMMLVNIFIGVRYFTTGLLAVHSTNAIAPLFEIGVSCCVIFLLASYFYPKLAHFAGYTTIGGIMERVYGKASRTYTAYMTGLGCFLMVVAPLAALGRVAEAVGFSRLVVTGLFGVLVVGYSALRKRGTLSFLGVVKFLSLGIGMTYLFGQVLGHYNGSVLSLREAVKEMAKVLKEKAVGSTSMPFDHDTTDSLLRAFFWIGWPTLLLSPPVIQQLLTQQSTSTAKQGGVYFGVIYGLFKLILLGIALFMYVSLEGAYMAEGDAFFYLLDDALGADSGLAYQVVVLLMYCASLLGTAYLFFKALMVIVMDNLPTTGRAKRPMHNSSTNLLVYLVGGSLAILCAYFAKGVLPTTLVRCAIGLLGALTIPLLAGVSGLRGQKKIFLYSVSAFLLTSLLGVVLCYVKEDWLAKGLGWIGYTSPGFPDTYYYLLPLVAGLSGCIFCYLHYARYRRFSYVKRAPLSLAEKGKKRDNSWTARFYAPLDWATTQLRYYGKAPELLGIIFMTGYLVWGTPWHHDRDDAQVERYMGLLDIGRMCGMVLATGLILRPVWPVGGQRFFPLYWLLTLWFCIPFTNVLLFLHAPNELVFLAWCLLSSLLLALVVDRKTFLLLMVAGLIPGWAIYHFGIPFVYRYQALNWVSIIYSVACVGLILVIRLFFITDKDIAKLKEQQQKALLTRHFYQELDEALGAIPVQDLKEILAQETMIKQQESGEVLWAFHNQQSYQKLVGYISRYERQWKMCQLKNVVFTKLLLDQPSDALYRQQLKVADCVKSLYQQLSPAYQVKVHIEAIDPSYTIWVATPFFDYIMQTILYTAVHSRMATNIAIHWNSVKKCLSIIDNGTPLPLNNKELFNLDNIRYYSKYAFPLIKLILTKMQAGIHIYQDGKKQVVELFFPQGSTIA